LASPGLAVLVATLRHADVASEVLAEMPHISGNIVHDAHAAILMREHGIGRICTRDTDFHQFRFLEVIDPLRV
jgi:predicted nucleic acid-binding protein